MVLPSRVRPLAAALCVALGACGNPPPLGLLQRAIERHVRVPSGLRAELVDLTLGPFAPIERPGARGQSCSFTAVLVVEEAVAAVVETLGDTRVVVTLARAKDRLVFEGRVEAILAGDHWTHDVDLLRSPWAERLAAAGRPVTSPPQPLARLGKTVEAGSAEESALRARLADERQAAERVRGRAALGILAVADGAIVLRDGGPEFGVLLHGLAIDEATCTARGQALDLQALPLREQAVVLSAVDRSGRTLLVLEPPLAEGLAEFGPPSAGVFTGAGGARLRALAPPERAALDAFVARARAAASTAPIRATIEVVTAAERSAREATAGLEPLAGTVLLEGRVHPAGRGILPRDTTSATVANWTGAALSIRSDGPTPARALWLRGGRVANGPLEVLVNGVHRIPIAAIEAGAALLIAWPEALDLVELRLTATGAASSMGVFVQR